MPSSRIDSTRLPLRVASETSRCDAWACFAALAKASDATKYAATSIGSGRRVSVLTSRSTGIVERRASVRNAGPRPALERIAGWIPREISRSSATASISPVARDIRLRGAHRQSERNQPLLRAVVEVSLDLPASLVRRRDDPPARGGQLRPAIRIRDRGGDQVRELRHALLRAGRELLAVCPGGNRPPERPLDHNRDRHGATNPQPFRPAVDGLRRAAVAVDAS